MADKIIPYLLLHLVQTLVCAHGEDQSSLPYKDLTCSNDFNNNITCFWNGTRGDTDCTVYAEKRSKRNSYNGSCQLEPVDLSVPQQKKCSVVFEHPWRTFSKLTINLNCNNLQRLSMNYTAAHHVKLNPPPEPSVNLTTVNWSCQAQKHIRIEDYEAELQWKKEEEPWSSLAHLTNKECRLACTAQLTEEELVLGERYEARVRVRPSSAHYKSTWSEWSPAVSWESHTGRVKSTQEPSGVGWSVLSTVLGALVFAALIILIRSDKTKWDCIVKRIKGPPLPTPEKSFLRYGNFQNLVSPHWSSESYHSLSKQVDIVPVKVTSPEDLGLYAALLENMKNRNCYESNSSNFSNPIYPHLCSPPVVLLSTSNLDACDSDTPYGPVDFQGCCQSQENPGDKSGAVEGFPRFLFGSSSSGPVPVVLEYGTVESQVQGLSFKCQDLCCGKENSERSLEACTISMTDGHHEVAEKKAEMDMVDFQKLFGSPRILNEGSIQVCSEYEQVPTLHAMNNELPSLDSGVSSGVEDQVSQEESLEETDTDADSNHLFLPQIL